LDGLYRPWAEETLRRNRHAEWGREIAVSVGVGRARRRWEELGCAFLGCEGGVCETGQRMLVGTERL
jgi:hypothetical protein